MFPVPNGALTTPVTHPEPNRILLSEPFTFLGDCIGLAGVLVYDCIGLAGVLVYDCIGLGGLGVRLYWSW
ncbi:hypothetical protein CEXT_425291 [Caerostris extrusa]|uniref:Uncharacterized protein n=1 Tax=Caerostris extrusa TaxID=172846 RepID=A0AAV4UXV1_CAEEX|nr:hypothetical protein CEXT_425291 [Caerostris extrusa]